MDYYQKYIKYKTKYINIKSGGGSTIYRINIQNPPESPWLTWIKEGTKEYEGRVPRENTKWTKMKIGDIIIFESPSGEVVETIITDIIKFKDFKEAYETLGQKLVPIKNITSDKVANLYRQYFSDEIVKQFGVIAIAIKVIRECQTK